MDEKNANTNLALAPLAPATKFAVLASPNDFGLYIGLIRVGFASDGMPTTQEVQYTHGFSVSPSSAKQLSQILATTIQQYEATFGPIPMGPDSLKGSEMPLPSAAAAKA